jgi:hypothetical protein
MHFEFVVHITEDPLRERNSRISSRSFSPSGSRTSSTCGKTTIECLWPVEVLFDGEGRMYLDAVFKKFARAHSLEVGCMLLCPYKGDDDMSVSVYDDSCCRMLYHSDDSGEDRDGQL